MEKGTLTPYCINLPSDQIKMIKKRAGERMVSSFIRDALDAALSSDAYTSGYNKAIRDACQLIKANQDSHGISIHGEALADIMCDQISGLEK